MGDSDRLKSLSDKFWGVVQAEGRAAECEEARIHIAYDGNDVAAAVIEGSNGHVTLIGFNGSIGGLDSDEPVQVIVLRRSQWLSIADTVARSINSRPE